MEAKFIGQDGSMGFKNGEIYKVRTYVRSKMFERNGLIILKDTESNLYCPYSRVETLLRNWEIL